MGRCPRGVRKEKRLEENIRQEDETPENLRKMREAVEESNVKTKTSFQNIIDLESLSQMEAGRDKDELYYYYCMVEERKLRLKKRKKELMEDEDSEHSLEKRNKVRDYGTGDARGKRTGEDFNVTAGSAMGNMEGSKTGANERRDVGVFVNERSSVVSGGACARKANGSSMVRSTVSIGMNCTGRLPSMSELDRGGGGGMKWGEHFRSAVQATIRPTGRVGIHEGRVPMDNTTSTRMEVEERSMLALDEYERSRSEIERLNKTLGI